MAAVWVTLGAEFLAHPAWLAAQKADFILGPVFVGLYWRRVRPESRFGWLLIAFGFVGAVYTMQSSSNQLLFSAGVVWEIVIYLVNLTLILTFPTGRLDGRAAKWILLAAVILVAVPSTSYKLLSPQLGADSSLAACRALCPPNALLISAQPALASQLADVRRWTAVAVALATGALLVWRLLKGTPPQRRAMAIGAPIALLFTVTQITYNLLKLYAPDATALHDVVLWLFAAARSSIWYGFLFALIAAQLFAGRALARLVRQSLRRPSRHELEAMLRIPLGDPGLRLALSDPRTGRWDSTLEPASGQRVTIVERDGQPGAALIHDAQLDDDPELLHAAGEVALLAAENAELDAAWNDALQELRLSRARIVRAGDRERRRVERNLHDGVQQRLVAVLIELGIIGESVAPAVREDLQRIGGSVSEALEELREVSHGLSPPVLANRGLVAALKRALAPLPVLAKDVGRHATEIESAVYYCCLEAVQNATKHGGPRFRSRWHCAKTPTGYCSRSQTMGQALPPRTPTWAPACRTCTIASAHSTAHSPSSRRPPRAPASPARSPSAATARDRRLTSTPAHATRRPLDLEKPSSRMENGGFKPPSRSELQSRSGRQRLGHLPPLFSRSRAGDAVELAWTTPVRVP